ncbi:MAG TPA: DUF6441 family protein [Sphingomicrobium sp.]|nr:DUF6441 family protein [Sphingomicrobium sp.]
MRVTAGFEGLEQALAAAAADFRRSAEVAVGKAAEGIQRELREQTRGALGQKTANTWRSNVYANEGSPRGPAALVFSKAPRIIDFFRAERVVTPGGKTAFAIPVNPMIAGRGRKATIKEVEARLGKLEAVPLPSGNIGLFAVPRRAKTLIRRKGARPAERILMFVLVRSIMSRKLIDMESPRQRWSARLPGLLAEAFENSRDHGRGGQ